MMEDVIGRHTVKSIAKELNLTFRRMNDVDFRKIRTFAKQMCTNEYKTNTKLVTLIDKKSVLHAMADITGEVEYKEVDALLFYCGKVWQFSWTDVSKAAIRKFMQTKESNLECSICFDDVYFQDMTICTQCSNRVCPICCVKICLTKEMTQKILNGDFQVVYCCPGCRSDVECRFMDLYVSVMDRPDEFTKDQAKAIFFAHDGDNQALAMMFEWMQTHPLKWYKPGLIVRIDRLKSKTSWDGKLARIVGNGALVAGIFRWPIVLVENPLAKASLKQINMALLEFEQDEEDEQSTQLTSLD